MSLKSPFTGFAGALLLLSLLFAGGCATTPTYTYYELSSNPPGAEVYRGTSPDSMVFYKTTPFVVNSPSSLSWSNKYFQARKKGFKDSEIHHQPFFPLGTASRIHFDLASSGGMEEFAAYQQRGTLVAHYEFIQAFPDSPIKDEVYASMVTLIGQADDPAAEYARLAAEQPQAVSQFPDDIRLSYIGPEGMRVGDIVELMQQGIGEAIIEQKILSAGEPYAEFSFDEIRQLTAMGLTDKVIAAMLKATQEHAAKAEPVASQPSATPSPTTMQGYVAPGSAPAQGQGLGDTVAECAAFLAKKEACDQLGGFAGMICMKAIPAGHNCF